MAYKIVTSGKARPFTITGGLRVGYGSDAKTYEMSDVFAAHHEWQKTSGNLLGLMVSPADPSYGWPEDDGIVCASEPGLDAARWNKRAV